MKRAEGSGLWAWLGLAALALIFVVVSQRLFAERYSAGDVFPAYSSWGSQAKGTRALYQALAALGRPTVRRSVQPIARLPEVLEVSSGPTTVILAGVPAWWTSTGVEGLAGSLDALARSGVRVVVALATTPRPNEARPKTDTTEAEESDETPEEEGPASEAVNLFGLWSVRLAESQETLLIAHRVVGDADSSLPAELPWPSSSYFELANEEWTVLYAAPAGPVLVERGLGAGSLVLATANYFLTNEAQAHDRQTALVSFLLGDAQRVVFEESHLGIVATPGVVALARRYRLHGVGLAVLLVIVLAGWRGASRLMPATESQPPSAIAARSSRQGLVSLLRRGISERDLLRVCLEQWAADSRHDLPGHTELDIARSADPVDGYRRLSRLLQGTRRRG